MPPVHRPRCRILHSYHGPPMTRLTVGERACSAYQGSVFFLRARTKHSNFGHGSNATQRRRLISLLQGRQRTMVFLPYDNQRYFTRKIRRLLPGQSSRPSIEVCGPHAVTWVRLCGPRSVFLSNLDPRTLCSVRIFVSRRFARPLYWVRIRKKVTVRAKRGQEVLAWRIQLP